MPRLLNKLTNKEVRDARPSSGNRPSRLGDGSGLYLQITPMGAKSWLFIYRWENQRPEIGLGSFPTVGLADARRKAEEARRLLGEQPKRDPRIVWATSGPANTETRTFGEFVEEWLPTILCDFRNEKHRNQWSSTLKTYAKALWSVPLNDIGTSHVLGTLQPIWNKKRETADRVRGRIERVLDAAKVRGLRCGENPARWRGHLSTVLPNQKPPVSHFAAMPYQNVPEFMTALADREAMSALCLRFLILTAVRSGEARGARWSEIDLTSDVWTIPAERMKSGKRHRVPLSPEAVAILRSLLDARVSELVFPGQSIRRPLSEAAFRALLDRAGAKQYTTHGFRSAFRDWCGEITIFPREVAETALAHTIGDKAEQAYRRGDALQKRRQLMEAWAEHCAGAAPANVVRLHG